MPQVQGGGQNAQTNQGVPSVQHGQAAHGQAQAQAQLHHQTQTHLQTQIQGQGQGQVHQAGQLGSNYNMAPMIPPVNSPGNTNGSGNGHGAGSGSGSGGTTGAGLAAGVSASSTAGAANFRNSNTDVNSNSTVGQYQPPGIRPRVTTTMWEDEKTLCYQVDANNVSVVRRADNNMINGTKLLNVAQMTRGRRDGILKLEKVRHVVKIGSMHLKGVWIPFERALAMAQREGIVDLLYPLFVRDIKRVIQTGISSNKYYEASGSGANTSVAASANSANSTSSLPVSSNSGPNSIPGNSSTSTAPNSVPNGQPGRLMPIASEQPMINNNVYGYQYQFPNQYYYNGIYNNQMYPYQYVAKPKEEDKKD